MRRDEPVAVEIHDLTNDGRGVAELDGQPIFVAGALPDERVWLKLRRRRRGQQEAELVSVIEPSESRVEPQCRYFGRCGGCSLQHLAYEAQLSFKQRAAAEALRRIGGVEPEDWLDPVPSPQWNYRRRARLSARFVPGKQRTLVGFRERAASYVTDMASCPVLEPPLDSALGELAEVVTASSIKDRLPQVEVALGDRSRAIVLRVLDPPTESDIESFQGFRQPSWARCIPSARRPRHGQAARRRRRDIELLTAGLRRRARVRPDRFRADQRRSQCQNGRRGRCGRAAPDV